MQITCYSNFSKKPNSTKQPTGSGTVVTCALKKPTSIIHPVFELQGSVTTYNYIQWGSRYYFIDDVILTHNNYTEYHCSIDVLASWKTEIGSSSEYVVRSYTNYDGLLPDFLYPVTAGYTYNNDAVDLTTGIVPDPTGTLTASWDNSSGTYVVGIAGDSPASGSIGYYAMTAGDFSDLLHELFATTLVLDTNATDIAEATQKQLLNPFQYIVSCNWFPFAISTSYGKSAIKIGWWTAQTAQGYILTRAMRSIEMSNGVDLTAHPDAATRGGYLNNNPFTRRTLYAWTFGQIPLNAMDYIRGRHINVTIDIDLFTGNARLDVTALDTNSVSALVARQYAQMCAPVQISQVSQDIIGGVSTAITTGAAAALIPGGLGFLGLASGINSAVHSVMPQVQTKGTTGSNIDFTGTPRVVSQYAYQAAMDDVHNGRPLCMTKTINTLSGYVKTENAEVDIPATQTEREAIASMMDSGFYYE